MNKRPRRNRRSSAIRQMVSETNLGTQHLIYPLFIEDGSNIKTEIKSLPSNYRWSLDLLLPEIEECVNAGLDKFVLFPAVKDELKDTLATYSYADDNFYLNAIRAIKERFPHIELMSDVAMDPYSSDGHDGLVRDGRIINDESLPILGKMAIAQAQAGIDIIGPSDMMDGRVGYLREALDKSGHSEVNIMSYTAKYASAYYGPFRDALDSAPKAGDKKTYQMDCANRIEAMRETEMDIAEGADIIMVKPGLAYLDIIRDIKNEFDVPIAAYQVSGEYAMIKAASEKGWLEHDQIILESTMAFKRAGANLIASYFAKDIVKLIG